MPDSAYPRNSERIEAALRHVAQGFAVVSVWSTLADGTCKCVKGKDCISPGKHPIPPTGFLAASRDPETVRIMLSAGSDPNYGIVWPEGDVVIVILDVDGDDWREKVDDLKQKYGPLPPTKTTRTPSGGLHLFYRWPDGVAVPDGNKLHGFVARFPWKGYVVGPGSAINGSVYAQAGPDAMAVLPASWVPAQAQGQTPLIVVTDEKPAYEMPERVETGSRHDEIVRLVASMWNRKVPLPIIEVMARELAGRFADPMDDARLTHEIAEAYRTAGKKWETPAGATMDGAGDQVTTTTDQGTVIDPLAIETRLERPEALDFHALPTPLGLAMLLDHLDPLTDAPHTSLALSSMVVMSALVGPAPTLRWRGSHRCALFGCLVGHSGVGRKGAAMRETERVWMQVDPTLKEMQTGGIASGEVLVDILNEAKDNPLTFGTALIWEHEIGNVLIIASREGSIMSSNIRKAWDGDKVESRSRAKNKSYAIGYNVAFLGGVTPAELAKRLSPDDIANGWANRFIWFHSEKRPGGYRAGDDTLNPAALDYLQQCVEFGRRLGGSSLLIKPAFTMTFAPDAEARMEVLAESLDVPPVGSIGALRQRMPAHIVRLSMVSALLDMSSVVTVENVAFAEALAGYAVDSMRAVFGVRVDDPLAMLVLSVLAQVPDHWLNTSDLRRSTGGKDHSRLMSALRVLLDGGLIEREDRRSGQAGRPSVGYRLK